MSKVKSSEAKSAIIMVKSTDSNSHTENVSKVSSEVSNAVSKNTNKEAALEAVSKTLTTKISSKMNKLIMGLAKEMPGTEVIRSFNQASLDFFNIMIKITTKVDKLDDFKMDSYLSLMERAIKVNHKIGVEKFTLAVLEYADGIYAENEDYFMDLEIKDTEVTEVGSANEFSVIRTANFKRLWKILEKKDRKKIREAIIQCTTFAHVYFFQEILKNHTT